MNTNDKAIDEERRNLLEMIEMIKGQYMKAIEPYVERLSHLEQMRGISITMSMEQARDLNLIDSEARSLPND